jgi:hypothetical protein
MKSAVIRDVLDVWVAEKGGTWEPMEGRPGDRPCEWLIGESEVDYTRAIAFGDVQHYLISFNERASESLTMPISSDNAERLSPREIASLIAGIPVEEL